MKSRRLAPATGAHAARQGGFTLLELMLVVGISGILASLAIGFSGSYVTEQKLKEVARGVQSAISMARAEAVRTSTTVVVTIGNGRIYAYKDVNNNGLFDSGDINIFQYPASQLSALPSTVTVTTNDFPSVGSTVATPTIYFNYDGLSVGPRDVLRSGKVCIKDSRITSVRAVQMTVAGACRIQSQAQAKVLCP